MTTRRAFLSGLGALVAAPAVIRTPGLLMQVRVYDDIRFRLWRQYRDLFTGEDAPLSPWAQFVDHPTRFVDALRFAARGDFIEHRGGNIGLGTAFDEARTLVRDGIMGNPMNAGLGSPIFLERGFSRRERRIAAGLAVEPRATP